MNYKFNFFCNHPQLNHLHAPKYFDWVGDNSGCLDVFYDGYTVGHKQTSNGKAHIALLIEPRTIQPEIYQYMDAHWGEFDLIFTHDEKMLQHANALPIVFMNWYKSYDVVKNKSISMVCSDKVMCEEHKQRQILADRLGNLVDHYGTYKGGRYCDYFECRAEYLFEVVVDNNWSGYWLSEKIANPIASRTVPIYLGGKHVDEFFNTDGIIIVDNINELYDTVKYVRNNQTYEYSKRATAIEDNFERVKEYQVFEDWWFKKYRKQLEGLI